MDTLSASFSTWSIQTEAILVYTYECTAALAVDVDFVSSTHPSLIEYRRRLLGIVKEADEASKCGFSVSLSLCIFLSSSLIVCLVQIFSFVYSPFFSCAHLSFLFFFLFFCLSSFSLIGIVVDYSLQLCHHHPLVAYLLLVFLLFSVTRRTHAALKDSARWAWGAEYCLRHSQSPISFSLTHIVRIYRSRLHRLYVGNWGRP